ncbi:rod shape-determining protein MreC [Halanaerocella petrolearia]
MLEILRKHYKKISVIVLIALIILFINLMGIDEDYNLLEGTVVDLLNPIFLVSDIVEDWTSKSLRVVLSYKQVKEENERLRKKVATLLYNQQQLEKVMLQNQRLRKLLNFKKYTSYQVVGASVISYSTDNWSNSIIINQGEEAGLSSKMAVVAKNGYLIGRVQRTSQYTAQVILLNDPNFLIGGLVRREESRDLGIVKGQPKEDNLVMDNIAWDADIKIGDTIATSGLSQHYPKGIPIGEVISVSPDDYGLTQEATLTSFVDLRKLEEVLIIKDFDTKTDLLLPSLDKYPKLNQEEE